MEVLKPEKRIENFEKMAFGMFIHWGLYSRVGLGEWAMFLRKIPQSEYEKNKDSFSAEGYDAKAIVKLAKRAGMKYITHTTRHHEGFSLYDTRGLSRYDSKNSPAGKDLIEEFIHACRSEGILPILYHTTLDWHVESYKNNFDEYLSYLKKSVELLCTHYGEIGGLWFDGNWDKPDADWRLDELYGTIRRLQPNALIINNTGLGARGEIGHPEIDSVTYERGTPGPINREGMSKYITGEMCQTMNDHWGIAKNDFNYKSPAVLIEDLCTCRKAGANYLLNVGPDGDGRIVKMQEGILEVIGDWMKINGRPIYEGKPCDVKGQGKDFALQTEDGKLYLFIHDLGVRGDENVTIGGAGSNPKVFTNVFTKVNGIQWLDNGEVLTFTQDAQSGLLCFDATDYLYGNNLIVRVAEVL